MLSVIGSQAIHLDSLIQFYCLISLLYIVDILLLGVRGNGYSHFTSSMTSVVCPFLPQEQYTLCFELLQAYLDSFDTYANFKALYIIHKQ